MLETPVLQSTCSVCGSADAAAPGGMCPHCSQELGSVVMIPGTTVVAEPAPAHIPPSLRHFGDYEIVAELARGGMGVVYVARQISLNRRVALKMILTPFAGEVAKRRFRAEAEHTATLEHPNIIPVYDCGEVEGLPYFTMKLIHGRSLYAELRRLVLDSRKGIALLATVARAVHYAHERGILHRDLKPHNILIDAQGVPYVGDFGIAKRVETETVSLDATQTGVIGTPQYMSPEQAAGDSTKITTATDVYSIGAILYEMLTLRLPFVATTKWEILQKVKSADPIPPRKLRASVNRDLETICLKCLEKNPARRYASASELASELERWLKGEPIIARPHSMWERSVKWTKRRPAVASSAALAALLLLAVFGFSWRSSTLVRNAEQRRIDERIRAAAVASADGTRALDSAREAAAANRSADVEKSLIQAEDRFRVALFNRPGDAVAEVGLCETALLSFDAALRVRNWRQAREKLLLARSAALSPAEFDQKQAALTRLESERSGHIRARVKALMDDAASLTRTVTHEMAVYELIAMKDDLTIELLKPCIGHERPECRRLACDALAWIGNPSIVRTLLTQIDPKTPAGKENPASVQVAALSAVCMLAPDDDSYAYNTVRRRIFAEPDDKHSLLYYRIKLHYDEFARRQARHLRPTQTDTLAKLFEHAQRASDANSFQEALDLYDRLVSADPSNVNYVNLRGVMRQQLKDYAGALADFNRVIELLPREKIGYINRSGVRSDLGDRAGALSDLDKAVDVAPEDSGLLSTRGLARMNLGDVNGAMEDYEHALKLNPEDIYAMTNRGHARAAMRDFTGALADFDRVLALSPLFRQALTGRACTRMELHDTDGALADFDKTLALDPTQVNCYFNRGILKGFKKDLPGAISEYDRCIALSPENGKVYYNRGNAKSATGDKAGAVRDYERAIELDPQRAEPMVNLGCIREAAGENAAALSLFDRAVTANPRQFEAWYGRSRMHSKLAQTEQAAKDLRTALTLLPNDAPKEMREELLSQLKQFETASRH